MYYQHLILLYTGDPYQTRFLEKLTMYVYVTFLALTSWQGISNNSMQWKFTINQYSSVWNYRRRSLSIPNYVCTRP